MRFTQMSIIALLWTAFSVNANGTGGIMLIMQHDRLKHKAEDEVIVPGLPSDGFIFSRQYYRSGADFFVCDGISSDKGKVVAIGGGCSVKIRVVPPWYSLKGVSYTYEHIGAGLTLQQHLDKEIGEGLTKPVSVGLKGNALIVFYKKVKD
ncbi:hypothetical protein FWP31_04705 [Vibrio cholerae]|nr:hypothetical protein [Vibrio cholerae]